MTDGVDKFIQGVAWIALSFLFVQAAPPIVGVVGMILGAVIVIISVLGHRNA